MFNKLTASDFDLPEPDDPDDLEKPLSISVHYSQTDMFRKVVGDSITSEQTETASSFEFQILAKHRDKVQALLDAHQGD